MVGMESIAEYINSLERISSRYEIPDKLTDAFIQSICSKMGTIERIWGFCNKDISCVDFSDVSPESLFEMAFNRFTRWPASLPKYDYEGVLNDGKDPGLSVSRLHREGINGSGISMAVIDKPFLSAHSEFSDCLVNYINITEGHEYNDKPDFHGITCAGFACGKTVGVAPGAKMYYYANPDSSFEEMWSYYFSALDRIIEHNRVSDEKIRVVSISAGIPNSRHELIERMDKYVAILAEGGCYVIYAGNFGKVFTCSCRVYGTGPDDVNGYRLDSWQTNEWDRHRVLIPSGGRTSPCNSGVDAYMYNGNYNCYSWAIPYIAGVFALALQVDRNLTYDEFSLLAQETATQNNLGLNVLNPVGLIEQLKM